VLKEYTKSGTIRTEGRSSKNSTGKGVTGLGPVFLMIIITLLAIASPASGQRRRDIGFMTALPWYLGDIAAFVPQPASLPPAIGPMIRYNIDMRSAIRFQSTFYDLEGSGEIFGGTEAEFQASFVDLGLNYEFNWWPYQTAHQKTKYSPYVTAGVGYSIDRLGEAKSHLFLPFGGGLKANLGKKLSGGIEVSMRKTFNDLLDGVQNPGGEEVQRPVGNNDWYMFTGIFLTYKIFNYQNECPTYQEKGYRLKSNSKRNKTDNWYEKPHDKESVFDKIGALSKGGKKK
jgi:hypothetical protein